MEQLYDPTPDEEVYRSVRDTLESARTKAAAAVNDAMVSAYWEIGRRIAEAQGNRAEYGKHLMEYLSERLTAEFGKGFTERNLRATRQLYLAYPIRHTLCAELGWSHYRLISNRRPCSPRFLRPLCRQGALDGTAARSTDPFVLLRTAFGQP